MTATKTNEINLLIDRFAIRDTYTIGKLYINGIYFCDTLEDRVRDYNKDGDLLDKGETKIFGETAIPYTKPGLFYIVKVTMSPKFKRRLPRVFDVPHFDGILFHRGRIALHSHGCVLVGKNNKIGELENGKYWEEQLVKLLDVSNVTIKLRII